MRIRSHRREGFTLLEVMISVAVAGALLVTLLYTLNYHLGIADRHETVTMATLLGMEKLAEVRQNPSQSEGEFPPPYENYAFKTEIQGTQYPGVSEISVTVKAGREEITLREYIRGEAMGK